MAGFSLPGIGSGIDAQSIANALYDQLTLVNTPRRNSVSHLNSENDSLEKLRSLLQGISDSVDKARSANGGSASKTVASSNTTVATAAASPSALVGNYSINVTSLASAGTGSFNRSFSSGSDFIVSSGSQAGTLSFTVGAGATQTSFDVNVGETTSAQDFVSQFNSSAQGKATASLVNIGNSNNPDYKIVFHASDIGTEKGNVSVTSSNPGLLASGALDGTTINQATDAQLTVSGVSGTITRSTNSVGDVVSGVTLQLSAVGSSTLSVQNDAAGTKSLVRDFVAAYNEFSKYAKKEDQVTIGQGKNGTINTFGSLAKSGVDEDATSAIRSAINGASSGDGTLSLASLGVSTNRDGSLSFDEKAFDTAFAANSTGVTDVVTKLADGISGVQGAVYQFTGYGLSIDQALKGNQAEIETLNKTIASVERNAKSQQDGLLKQFSQLDSLIGKLNSASSYISSLF